MSTDRLDEARLKQILRTFPDLRLAVLGDFFLDAYYDCDPVLNEKSLETGKNCYQVIRLRRQAGAAGTVAANLVALGVGTIEAVGFCGDDGEGYELRRAMDGLGLDRTGFFLCPERFTPTYGKPCYINGRAPGKPVVEELERLDTKNRRSTPVPLQEQILDHALPRLDAWDGLILVDQANEPNCGVLTSRVRRRLTEEFRRRPDGVFLADSRERIDQFRHVMIKPNQFEAAQVLGRPARRPSLKSSATDAGQLVRRTDRPVFLTLGEKGMLVADGTTVDRVSGVPVSGPIDPVGAGDSTSAAIVASLAAGASLVEAATIANLVASITVQQIGTTGTARPTQILRRLREVAAPRTGAD
jgi:bifunctional ADP-heptose synthase (sugar kinase/adenylyltransferase)